MKRETDYGLAELLSHVDAAQLGTMAQEMKDRLRDWYFKHTRLETFEMKIKSDGGIFQEHLAEVSLKTGFGGHLKDVGAATYQIEHFTEESVHSIEARVVLPPLAATSSDGVQIARMILNNQRR